MLIELGEPTDGVNLAMLDGRSDDSLTIQEAAAEPPRRWHVLFIALTIVLGIDQAVKWAVINRLTPYESWHLIPDISSFIRITRSYNTGAAFGMFQGFSDVFLVLAIIAVGVFLYMYPTLPAQARWSRIGVGMICGGALSNAIDRIRFGHVVDYVHVQLGPDIANISNLADHAIVIGMAILVIEQFFWERLVPPEPLTETIEEDADDTIELPREELETRGSYRQL